jgi:hypothetical protein
MRSYFNALGLSLSASVIQVPARRLMTAKLQEDGNKIVAQLREKFIERLLSYK